MSRIPQTLLLGCGLGCVLGCAMHFGPRSEHLTAAELAGFRHERGEVLLARLDCVACHPAGSATLTRLAPLPAPDLGQVGARRPASWLSDFLDAPHAAGGQAVMPDLLGPLSPNHRREARQELLHFLVSLGGPMVLQPEPPVDWPIERGAALFTSLGCRACHEDDLDAWCSSGSGPDADPGSGSSSGLGSGLARGYDRRTLTAFLRDPLAVRPSGAMPDMELDLEQADALAAWLLRERFLRGPSRIVRSPGLRSDIYVFDEDLDELPDFDAWSPTRTLVVDTVEHEQGDSTDRYAVRLRGDFYVPTTGEHVLYTSSDDGSALWVDGELIVDNDGLHARQREDGTVTLDEGWHELEVTYFENDGDAWLEAGWVVEGEGEAVTEAEAVAVSVAVSADVSVAETVAVAVPVTEAEAVTEPVADSEAEAVPEAEPVTEAEAVTKAVNEADSEPATEPEPGTRPFSADELRATLLMFEPDGWETLQPDARLVQRGRARFAELGCVSCHAIEGLAPGDRGPPLDRLLWLEDGCLAPVVRDGLPDYHLDEADRTALREVLRGAPALTQPLDAGRTVDRTLARLGCTACHARGDAPGPRGSLRAAFSGTADLGDEGRLPPDLTGVGAKLRTSAIHDVLVGNTRVRPYMNARMPHFGEAAVGHLAEAFALADVASSDVAPADASPADVSQTDVSQTDATRADIAPDAAANLSPSHAFDAERLEAGRRLVGRGGLSCISCHEVAGQPSIGLPGMDLAVMHARLQPQWFRRWMEEPLAMRAGTRMPTFFDDGRSIITTELDGDAGAQIDAMWDYLGLGEMMPLPPGVVVDPAAYALVAVDRPVYMGSFMDGLSARVLSVGFPENVHVAFDQQHVRLARAWTGRFFDAEGTWRGRAGQLEQPPIDSTIDLPAGPAFAFLTERDATPWPETSGKPEGWRMLGHTRDAAGLPTFRYVAMADDPEPTVLVEVEESPRPIMGPTGPALLRHFTLHVAAHVAIPALRVWAGRTADDTIAPAEGAVEGTDGAWTSTDGIRLVIRGADGHTRTTDDGMELLVVPRVSAPLDVPRSPTFEVELWW